MTNEEVLTNYEKAIHQVVWNYTVTNSRFDRNDLLEEAKLAAMRAASMYDEGKGEAEFLTYLTNALNRELQKFVGANAYDTSVSEHYRRTVDPNKLKSEAIAVRLDNDEGVEHYYVGASGSNVVDPESELIHKESIEVLREEIDRLPERDKIVIKGRFFEGKTLKDIAVQLNNTKQAIYQWEKQAFERLSKQVKKRLG